VGESPRSSNAARDENVVQASLPASSDYGGETPLASTKETAGSPPSVLFSEDIHLELIESTSPTLNHTLYWVSGDMTCLSTPRNEVLQHPYHKF